MIIDQTKPDSDPSQLSFPVIAIGASAGGLEALRQFFQSLVAEPGCAFIVVTHHKGDHPSLLPELLARYSELRCVEAADGMALEPNCIYTNPSGEWLVGLKSGRLTLKSYQKTTTEKTKGKSAINTIYHPVDYVFRQVAQELTDKAVGLILSGSGSDGTLGLQAIKAENGTIMAQEPTTAEFDGMPSTAIATGLVDYVKPPDELATKLGLFLQQRAMLYNDERDKRLDIPVWALDKICALLRSRTGNDFSSYKENTFLRRIGRRMALHGVTGASDYIALLESDEVEIDQLFKDLLIRVTSFFRDPPLWEACRKKVFQDLIKQFSNKEGLRVWVPGCATGEEAYTIAILLMDCMDRLGIQVPLQIFATDLDEAAIDIARKGEYPDGVKSDIPSDYLYRYFTYTQNAFVIHKHVREKIIFAPHNVIKDPPFTHVDIVSCRNLLIYLKQDLQDQLLSRFFMSLRQQGLLLLGPSESINGHTELFTPVNTKWKVYSRNENAASARLPTLAQAVQPYSSQYLLETRTRDSAHSRTTTSFSQVVVKLLAQRFAPSALLINERGDVHYLHAKAGMFLEPAEGRPRYNVFEMGRGDLPLELSPMLRWAASHEGQSISRSVEIDIGQESGVVMVSLEKLLLPEALRGLFLVTLQVQEPIPGKGAKTSVLQPAATDHRLQMETELERARSSYQALVEALEISNEELKSSNEELQSTNEELQSSNEELETSKEETQSLYEELSTVNSELQGKVDNLSQANDDMQNLLNSTNMAILYLDNRLHIKRFTDKTQEIIAIRESDEGRPIHDLATHLLYGDLVRDAKAVLNTLQGAEKEVQTKDGHWYLMKLLPYRTQNNVIDGLICTFVDIDAMKVEQRSESRMKRILSSLAQPLLVLGSEWLVKFANQAFCERFAVSRSDTENVSLMTLMDGVWSMPCITKGYKELVSGKCRSTSCSVNREFPGLGPMAFNVTLSVSEADQGDEVLILMTVDI
ncbi:CheR family methyltransferase [Marinobacter caseinilyticus]|uniref:CheR family methyltransferase n=1 Tax=Marinobacter caseinilyticus TaxID=2692195 RepID=UPI00140D04CC|nr:CheR family methyltransferase [Marinobacter caseinilyticus]